MSHAVVTNDQPVNKEEDSPLEAVWEAKLSRPQAPAAAQTVIPPSSAPPLAGGGG